MRHVRTTVANTRSPSIHGGHLVTMAAACRHERGQAPGASTVQEGACEACCRHAAVLVLTRRAARSPPHPPWRHAVVEEVHRWGALSEPLALSTARHRTAARVPASQPLRVPHWLSLKCREAPTGNGHRAGVGPQSPARRPTHLGGQGAARRLSSWWGGSHSMPDGYPQVPLRGSSSRAPLVSPPSPLRSPPALIGMEACGGAHYGARRFREHGHGVKLMRCSL